ncbi:MAG TPA: hypothetical protein VLF94_00300 [Chlamydiales bacterium]|nr:hypothetical protein [Chlamydiales bacterium]
MNATTVYLSRENLHFKPISARLMRGVLWGATTLEKKSNDIDWQGRAVHVASKAVMYTGAVLCIVIAAVEATCLLPIAAIGLLLNYFLREGAENGFLRKHSLKCVSYVLHNLLLQAALIGIMYQNPDLKYYTTNAILDNALYLLSAAAVQGIIGGRMDLHYHRPLELTGWRVLNLFRDGHPHMMLDVFDQVQRDTGTDLRERIGEDLGFEGYLHRHPEDRQFINTFNIENCRDPAYQQRGAEFAQRFLTDAGIIRGGAEGPQLVLNQNNNGAADAYQDRIERHVKDTFLEVYRTPLLCAYLDRNGRDLLDRIDPRVVPPLAAYAQYKELLREIDCPAQFGGNLARYNGRRASLLEAQQAVRALTEEQRRNLVQKTLRGAGYQVEPEVQRCFARINMLSADLYLGPLASRMAIDLQRRRVQGTLFETACQNALAEIRRDRAG